MTLMSSWILSIFYRFKYWDVRISIYQANILSPDTSWFQLPIYASWISYSTVNSGYRHVQISIADTFGFQFFNWKFEFPDKILNWLNFNWVKTQKLICYCCCSCGCLCCCFCCYCSLSCCYYCFFFGTRTLILEFGQIRSVIAEMLL